MQTCYLGKFWLTSYQPKCTSNDLRILWSSVSLERINRYLLFFARIHSQRKCSILDYCFWLALSRHAQTHSNLPRFTSGAFGWSWDMTRLKIFLNDSLRYIFHLVIWKLHYEWSISSLRNESFIHNLLHKILNYWLKCVLVQLDCSVF